MPMRLKALARFTSRAPVSSQMRRNSPAVIASQRQTTVSSVMRVTSDAVHGRFVPFRLANR
jgi:hypothetical protein